MESLTQRAYTFKMLTDIAKLLQKGCANLHSYWQFKRMFPHSSSSTFWYGCSFHLHLVWDWTYILMTESILEFNFLWTGLFFSYLFYSYWFTTSLTQWTWKSQLREIVKNRKAWHAAVHGVTKSRTWHRDETTTIYFIGLQWEIIYVFGHTVQHVGS